MRTFSYSFRLIYRLLFGLCLILVHQAAVAEAAQRVVVSLLKEKKLVVYTLDGDSGELALENKVKTKGEPGALCFNEQGDLLYVALKDKTSIAVYRVEPDVAPSFVGQVKVGAAAAYLKVHPSGEYLLSAYYAEGQVAVHRIEEDGNLQAAPVQVLKTDERAHSIVTDSSGEFVFVPHTRPNAIFQFVFDPQTGILTPNDPAVLQREENSGPRHLCFHPDFDIAYGSDEQGCSISVYEMSGEGQLKLLQTSSSLPPESTDEKKSTSEVLVHPSGEFVYIANRGDNTIASYVLDQVTGKLNFQLQQAPVEPVPRSFNISPDGRSLVAAGQRSGKLTVFQIGANGLLEHRQTLEAGEGPWWVAFQP